DPLVAVSADVVVMRQVLFLDELPQRVDVAVGHLVFGEDVVIGDDDHLVAVPDPGVLAEVLLEDADGAWAAHVVGHEDIGIDPDIVAWRHASLAGVPGEDLLGHGHCRHRESLFADGLQIIPSIYWRNDEESANPNGRRHGRHLGLAEAISILARSVSEDVLAHASG